MKRKSFILLLICEAVLVALLAALSHHVPRLFPSVLSFPLEPVADALRRLANTGAFGNGTAAALWIGISVIPALFALRGPKDRISAAERTALFVLSGLLMLGLYGMMNPQVFSPAGPAGKGDYANAIRSVFDITVWAGLVLYIVLRLIRLFGSGSKERLLGYLNTLLKMLCMLFTAIIAVSLVNGLTEAWGADTDADRAAGILRTIMSAVPYLLDIAMILTLLELIRITGTQEQEGLAQAARKLRHICCLALGISAAVPVLVNTVQILLMPGLTDISVTADIPLVSIVLSALILLLSRILNENKRLRDDNSLFI